MAKIINQLKQQQDFVIFANDQISDVDNLKNNHIKGSNGNIQFINVDGLNLFQIPYTKEHAEKIISALESFVNNKIYGCG